MSGWKEVTASAANVAELKLAVAETQSLRHVALAGDLYPLTAATADPALWAAYVPMLPPCHRCGEWTS